MRSSMLLLVTTIAFASTAVSEDEEDTRSQQVYHSAGRGEKSMLRRISDQETHNVKNYYEAQSRNYRLHGEPGDALVGNRLFPPRKRNHNIFCIRTAVGFPCVNRADLNSHPIKNLLSPSPVTPPMPARQLPSFHQKLLQLSLRPVLLQQVQYLLLQQIVTPTTANLSSRSCNNLSSIPNPYDENIAWQRRHSNKGPNGDSSLYGLWQEW